MEGTVERRPVVVAGVRKAMPADEAAVLDLLRTHKGLEAEFQADEFCVAADGSGILACARLRRHPDGAVELASVATRADQQGRGLASALVTRMLAAPGAPASPVFALALAPTFFARLGFREVERDALPASVRAKANGLCASQPYVAMAR